MRLCLWSWGMLLTRAWLKQKLIELTSSQEYPPNPVTPCPLASGKIETLSCWCLVFKTSAYNIIVQPLTDTWVLRIQWQANFWGSTWKLETISVFPFVPPWNRCASAKCPIPNLLQPLTKMHSRQPWATDDCTMPNHLNGGNNIQPQNEHSPIFSPTHYKNSHTHHVRPLNAKYLTTLTDGWTLVWVPGGACVIFA